VITTNRPYERFEGGEQQRDLRIISDIAIITVENFAYGMSEREQKRRDIALLHAWSVTEAVPDARN